MTRIKQIVTDFASCVIRNNIYTKYISPKGVKFEQAINAKKLRSSHIAKKFLCPQDLVGFPP